ncbi:MFS transporter [Pseudonocardia sp. NPDC049154]|uniref:MFS transporter n=1 Tax=Pseudonocardia sp. NPDC049154 TaxID=3155501 RepID=UPI0033F6E341
MAGYFGTLVEYYDFTVYAFLVVIIGPLFFPSDTAAGSVLATLAVFAVGYVARPLGGILIGRLGDRRGRRSALLLTVLGMGLATFLMGLLPTYSQVGVLAPLLLILVRLLQGVSAGGEAIGAVTLAAESAWPGRRGLLSSLTPFGAGTGIALAPAIVGLVTALTSPEQLASWGWRIPLLLSLPMTLVCLWFRLRLEDSPEFRSLVERAERVASPVREVLSKHWPAIIRVTLVAVASNCVGYVLTSYVNVYLINWVGIDKGAVFWLSAIALALALPTFVVSGLLIDRLGTRRVFLSGMAACCVLAVPAMLVMGSAGSLVVVTLAYWVVLIANNLALPPAYSIYVESFPTAVRYTGAALSFNIGTIIGGGLTPWGSAQLATATGSGLAPAVIIVVAAAIGLVVTLTAPRYGTDHFAQAPADPTPSAT